MSGIHEAWVTDGYSVTVEILVMNKSSLDVVTFTFLIILPVCLLSSACGVSQSSESDNLKPDVSISYLYYEISGETENDLRGQMDRFGPSDEQRVQHDAYTEWYVDWVYPNSETNGNCATGLITVTVRITHTFPKWDIPPETSEELAEKWNTYFKALQLHETGHRQIGIDAGYEILQKLNKLSGYPSCTALEEVADTTGENILDEFRQKEVNYDQSTIHGEAQGARFP